MKYYHVTPARNGYSILLSGILLDYSQCQQRRVFLVTKRLVEWGIRHTAKRHKARVADILVIEVDIPRRWLMNGKMRKLFKVGIWSCSQDIPPCRVVRFNTVSEWRAWAKDE